MTLDRRICYRALRTRDSRFDGRFFTAVRTTGVFCRPICPAPTPKLDNCLFLPSAAAAAERGFRPCLRCRPETSPGTPAWAGTSPAVTRALRLIAAGAPGSDRIDALAKRIGIGERQLRRIFVQHVGAPPRAVARMQRVLFAKNLLDETRLPMTEVALAAGFSSVRGFNAAIRKTYRRTPRELRRRSVEPVDGGLRLKLGFRPPFHWDVLAGYLRARATPGVEQVTDGAYSRTIRIDGNVGWFEVRPSGDNLEAQIRLDSPAALLGVAERLRRLFDLGADPHEISQQLSQDPQLAPLVKRLHGLRVPGAWDGFELAVRAVLGQQVTVKGATTLAGRLVRAFGRRLGRAGAGGRPQGLEYLFPTPSRLARSEPARIGIPGARATTIVELARAVNRGSLILDGSQDPAETLRRLVELRGVGVWTAQYIAMRALREPDAFPASDLGLRRACRDSKGRLPSSAALERRSAAWSPWRAYAAVHLWMAESGAVPG